MSVYFAAARRVDRSPVARALSRRAVPGSANDNGPGLLAADGDIAAALRHFAGHGLGAASNARCEAERALALGDHAGFRHWRAICRALDRRMAASLDHSDRPLGGDQAGG